MSSDHDEDNPTCPCKKKNKTLMLECDECETFWHTTCCGLTGLTQAAINKLIQNQWKCPRCFKFPESIPVEIETEDKTNLDKDTVANIISLVNKTVITSLKTLLSPETHSDDSDSEDPKEEDDETQEINFEEVRKKRRRRKRAKQQEKQQECVQKALEEQREEEILIEKKKNNLIIYGMPETNTEDKQQELIEDFNNLKKVYEGKVTIEKEDLNHMTRLGKRGTNPRPIQITPASQNMRKDLLTKNMNLKLKVNNESTPIYVSPDRTDKQRAEYRKLRDELTERKKSNPNLCIRNNKIIPFRPAAQETYTWAQVVAQE